MSWRKVLVVSLFWIRDFWWDKISWVFLLTHCTRHCWHRKTVFFQTSTSTGQDLQKTYCCSRSLRLKIQVNVVVLSAGQCLDRMLICIHTLARKCDQIRAHQLGTLCSSQLFEHGFHSTKPHCVLLAFTLAYPLHVVVWSQVNHDCFWLDHRFRLFFYFFIHPSPKRHFLCVCFFSKPCEIESAVCHKFLESNIFFQIICGQKVTKFSSLEHDIIFRFFCVGGHGVFFWEEGLRSRADGGRHFWSIVFFFSFFRGKLNSRNVYIYMAAFFTPKTPQNLYIW